jgi:hypothetical protein
MVTGDGVGAEVMSIARDGTVTLTTAQLAMLMEGLDWRTPTVTWRPKIARFPLAATSHQPDRRAYALDDEAGQSLTAEGRCAAVDSGRSHMMQEYEVRNRPLRSILLGLPGH